MPIIFRFGSRKKSTLSYRDAFFKKSCPPGRGNGIMIVLDKKEFISGVAHQVLSGKLLIR